MSWTKSLSAQGLLAQILRPKRTQDSLFIFLKLLAKYDSSLLAVAEFLKSIVCPPDKLSLLS